MSFFITICSLGPDSSYEPQVENINTLEEAYAYNEYLLGAMGRVQQSQANQEFLKRNENVTMASVNAEDMAIAAVKEFNESFSAQFCPTTSIKDAFSVKNFRNLNDFLYPIAPSSHVNSIGA
uniref:Uncharacterized protein n=1 Tax=Solanum lycopersicum TaxID=4081 RepID=A0A3Q7GR80_SOLLC